MGQVRCIQTIAFAIALGVLVQPAGAQSSADALNLVPSAPEVVGQVPQHYVWIRDGLQAAQDPVDGQLVFFNDEGRVVGRTALPPQFSIGSVVSDASAVRMLGTTGTSEVVIARNIEPASAALSSRTIARGTQPQIIQRNARRLVIEDSSRKGGSLEVSAISNGSLGQAYELGNSANGDRFVVTEEVAAGNQLRVEVFVHRYDRAGKLTGLAFVPLDDMDVVPRDFLAVTAAGKLRAMVPTIAGVKVRELDFLPPGRSVDFKRVSAPKREFSVETRISPRSDARQFRSKGERFSVRARTPSITREKMIANARAYLTINWVMSRQNFSRSGIENTCRPEENKFWTRPRHFTAQTVGQTIAAMPYRWGGFDTPETFKVRLEWGALAGDICTCRDPRLDYCLTPESTGVDCSGLISRAWGISKRGTTGLLDVSKPVGSLEAMRPGDAFLWPGHHVRLLAERSTGFASGFKTIESSTRLECEGVCERSYRPSELNGYRLVRYAGVTD